MMRWRFWIISSVSLTMICSISALFGILKYAKTGKTGSSDGFCIYVRHRFNVKLLAGDLKLILCLPYLIWCILMYYFVTGYRWILTMGQDLQHICRINFYYNIYLWKRQTCFNLSSLRLTNFSWLIWDRRPSPNCLHN